MKGEINCLKLESCNLLSLTIVDSNVVWEGLKPPPKEMTICEPNALKSGWSIKGCG
jgi:hypothetical protein